MKLFNLGKSKNKSGPKSKAEIVAAAGVTAGCLALVFVRMFLVGDVKASFGEDGITVSGTLSGSEEVLYGDIESVELRSGIDYGSRDFGFGGKKFLGGTFSNNEFGSYKLYVYAGNKDAVVVKYSGGQVLCFNLKTEEETEDAYKGLLSKI